MENIQFSETQIKKDLRDFINDLQHINNVERENFITHLRLDMFDTAFQELVASSWFASESPKRKRDLFNQYQFLSNTITTVTKFLDKYRFLDTSLVETLQEVREINGQPKLLTAHA